MPRKKQEILALFQDAFDLTQDLSDQQFGELMRAIGKYRFEGTKYTGKDFAVKMAFGFVSAQVDRYTDYCQSKRDAANARHNKGAGECMGMQEQQENTGESTGVHNDAQGPSISMSISMSESISNDNKADKPPTRHKFSPPTVEDVQAYCDEKGYAVDPGRFVDYYTSNGWRVGKNPMQDWRAAVRTWNGKEKPNGKNESKPAWKIGTVV